VERTERVEPQAAYAVVDIDGVVADVRHRLRFLDRRPKDWDAFFDAAVDDPLLPEGAAVVAELAARGLTVVWVTGRPERCRRDTDRWLRRNRLPVGDLHMRGDGDRRPARLTKLETIRRLSRTQPVAIVVDDDDAVVATVRGAGFDVLQAAWMGDDDTEDEQPVTSTQTLFDAQETEGRS
jgi:phosphoglycolate phosphatase-like HAD superfamily hydrolase